MTLSIVTKQNLTYGLLVVLVSPIAYFWYKEMNQEWVAYRQAEQYYHKGDFENAIRYYNESVIQGIDPKIVLLNVANAYVAKGQFNEGIELYREYLETNPKDNTARLELARTLSWIGNLEAAEAEYKKILEEKNG